MAYATGCVESAFGGEWNGRGPMAISEIAESPPRWEMCAALDGDSESASNVRTVHFPVPVWLDARPKGDACMCEALRSVKGIVERWTSEYRRGLPPTVVHFTDGGAADGAAMEAGTPVAPAARGFGC